jgi:DHA2 family multidrug resistance protein
MAGAFLFDPAHLKKPGRIDAAGLVLMVIGFICLQLVLDRGERQEWFDSMWVVTFLVIAVCALAGFVIRQLTAREPILDLSVFSHRNFAIGSGIIAMVSMGFFSTTLLIALYTQKVLGYDAWTSGMVLAPAGLSNMLSLVVAGRLVTFVDQRWLLATGCALNATALLWMSHLTLGVDYWGLVWPRVLQGLGLGFIFVPLTTLALATVPRERLGNATAAYNVVRNLGGSIGVALATTMLSRRSQHHQSTLVSHVDVWSAATTARLREWTDHFMGLGNDPFTAKRRAMAMLYHDTQVQAQVLAYADEFWLLSMLFFCVLVLVPFTRRVRSEPAASGRDADRVAVVSE